MTTEHVIAYQFFKALKGEGPAEFWAEYNNLDKLQPDYKEIHWPDCEICSY